MPGMADDSMSMAARGAALLGGDLERASRIAGGDLSQVFELRLIDGRAAVVKGSPAPAVEAQMLEAIRATGAPAPAVLAHDQTVLVLERLPGGGQLDQAWPDLGAVLSALHGAVATRFGWYHSYSFGRVTIDNQWTDNWAEFFAARRLRNQVPFLPEDLARRVSALADDLSNRLPAKPAPCLLHGDLWGGNILVAERRISGLIDPACYYGDREVDFAMLSLFDRPDDRLFEACGTLSAGVGERLPIYQLWPALVHLRLFGSGYRSLVERLLQSLGI